MKNRIILLILMLLMVCMGASAQVATIRNSIGWDAVPNNLVWATAGYDLVFAQTNVTAAQLGTSNTVPSFAGVINSTRVTNIVVALSTFVSTNGTPSTPYTFWVRTAANPIGDTNTFVVSDWTNLTVTWVSIPFAPSNIKIK